MLSEQILRNKLAAAVVVVVGRLDGRSEQHRAGVAVFLKLSEYPLEEIVVDLVELVVVLRTVYGGKVEQEVALREVLFQ